MENPFRLNDITEEQISKVVKYFDTYKNWHWDSSWESESQIRVRYWILHWKWELTLDIAEQEKDKIKKRNGESYRWKKEQEINDHLKEYRQQNYWNEWTYDLMRTYNREDGRQINIWIMVQDNDGIKRTHAVDIEERQNPDYFQEIVKRFNLVID